MTISNTQLEKAREYNRAKKYPESLAIYEELIENGEELSAQDKEKYAWDIFFVDVKENDSIFELEDACKKIVENTRQKNCFKNRQACVYTISVLKLMKFYSDNISYQNNAYKLILWAEKLNPDYLNTFHLKIDEKRRLSSNMEKWYLQITKALFHIKKYDDVINLSNEALEKIPRFNNSNDLWFKYRIAKSYKEKGEYEKSLEYLEDISKYKRDWFISYEIANNYYLLEDYDSSVKHAANAALSHDGKIESKLKLFMLIGDILKTKGYEDEYVLHKYLVYTIRNAKDWSQEDWAEELQSYELDISNKDYNAVYNELVPIWLSLKFINQERQYGQITKVFEDNKAGWIKSGNESYYFKAYEFKSEKYYMFEGSEVSFFREKFFDKKKNEWKCNAVNIYSEDEF